MSIDIWNDSKKKTVYFGALSNVNMKLELVSLKINRNVIAMRNVAVNGVDDIIEQRI
jgi:hypothetical protein